MSVTACFKLSPDAIFAVEQFEILERQICKTPGFRKWFRKLCSGSTDKEWIANTPTADGCLGAARCIVWLGVAVFMH